MRCSGKDHAPVPEAHGCGSPRRVVGVTQYTIDYSRIRFTCKPVGRIVGEIPRPRRVRDGDRLVEEVQRQVHRRGGAVQTVERDIGSSVPHPVHCVILPSQVSSGSA